MMCLLHIFFFFSVLIAVATSEVDHTSTFQSIADSETIGTTGGTFELGFFSPGSSTTRYMGYQSPPLCGLPTENTGSFLSIADRKFSCYF